MEKHEIYRRAAWLSGLGAVLVMAGCASAPPVPPSDTLAGGPASQQDAA
ncbi:peptidase, partial [Paraburkholderia sp. Se-20369]|nr:peptidase [Paraburkholderia sp. Se-20369]